MKYLTCILLLICLSTVKGQIFSPGTGMIYEDDPKHNGFVNGKIYFNNGQISEGLVLFAYTHTDEIRFKPQENSDYQKLSADDIIGFTLESDSFAVISNFSPEIKGITANTFFEKGFAKVLVDGPITLFKHYSLQSVRNMQIITVESFLLARKEEEFTRLVTIPTSKRDFINTTSSYFKRNQELSLKIRKNQPSFIAIRDLVKEYNESYFKVESNPEESSITIFRQRRRERETPIAIIVNDSIAIELEVFDSKSLKTVARINTICVVGGNCVSFRADQDLPQFVECSFTTKLEKPQVLYAHPLYASTIVESINKKKK